MKKRSKYRPKPVVSPFAFHVRPNAHEAEVIVAKYRSAFNSIVTGQLDVGCWSDIADLSNLCDTLTVRMRRAPSEEVMPTVNAAQDAAERARISAGNGVVAVLTEPEKQAITDLIDIFEQFVLGLPAGDLVLAEKLTAQRIQAIRASRRKEIIQL